MVFPRMLSSESWLASAMSMKPIMMRKERPRTWSEGWLFTKRPTGPEKPIIMRAETTTARIMTRMLLDRPMAVRMESMEKTRLMSAIWVTIWLNAAYFLPFWWASMCGSSPSSFWNISFVAL